MLHPTYNDLIKSINQNAEDESQEVESRFSVVIASAKRARQLIDGAEAMVYDADERKPLSVAVEEISKNKVTIEQGTDFEDDPVYETRKATDAEFARIAAEVENEEEEDEEDAAEESEEDGDDSVSEDNYESDSEA